MRYKIGDRIDKLVIIGDTKERTSDGGKKWLCVCDCGETCVISSNAIRKRLERTNHCDCGCGLKLKMQKQMTKIIPIGTKFPHFTIIDGPFYPKRHVTEYLVEFEDGTQTKLTRSSIRNNPNQYKSNHRTQNGELNIFKNQSNCPKKGQIYGNLTVIDDGFVKNNKLYFTCKCSCGSVCEVTSRYLNSSLLPNCGCAVKSAGENMIQNILDKHNISYTTEYVSDLKDKTFLRFDFAVFEGTELVGLIEYNGRQHYICDENTGWNDFDNFTTIQLHDKLKKEWSHQKNIPLLIIPYTINKYEDIESLLLGFIY